MSVWEQLGFDCTAKYFIFWVLKANCINNCVVYANCVMYVLCYNVCVLKANSQFSIIKTFPLTFGLEIDYSMHVCIHKLSIKIGNCNNAITTTQNVAAVLLAQAALFVTRQ